MSDFLELLLIVSVSVVIGFFIGFGLASMQKRKRITTENNLTETREDADGSLSHHSDICQ